MSLPYVAGSAELDFAERVMQSSTLHDALDLIFDEASWHMPVEGQPTIRDLKDQIDELESETTSLKRELQDAEEDLDRLHEIGPRVIQRARGRFTDDAVAVVGRCAERFQDDPSINTAAHVLAGLLAWGYASNIHWQKMVREADQLDGRVEP